MRMESGRDWWPRLTVALLLALLTAGCSWRELFAPVDGRDAAYLELSGQVQYEDASADTAEALNTQYSPPPTTIADNRPRKYLELTLDQVIEIGLQNSKVLRDLGGTILRAPDTLATIHNPAIQETDPRTGVEGALSVFDAQLSSNAFFENNDRALNNTFFGGGTRTLVQDFNLYQTQISKRTATGSALSLRNNTTYDANNAPGNLFPSAWDTNVEAEIRQPLLQGAGTFFNRVAGPGSAPGLYNGVLIAKVSRDMSLTEFEAGLRDYVSNLENAYWDLYFAYRDLDAKKTARDESLRTWQIIRARLKQRGFEADKEAQAREQYYRFQQEVQDALSGRVQDGTRTYNGSNGGTFRRTVGVHVAERRLRLLLGWPINGESLIRPATEPVHAAVKYDWDAILAESLARRTELRRQRQQVKQRELQLSASRSFLKPQFDAVGRYRWRGFGSNLLDVNRESDRFGNAVQNLTGGDFQEWQMGFEFSIPLGFRQAHAAVRNAELRLARERAILREQERQVVYHLSNAIEDVDRAYRDVQLGYNRLRAAKTRVDSLKSVDETSSIATPDQLLEAHNRLADAESRYYMSLVEYMIAVRNVHFEKGSLFDYHSIQLQDAHGNGDGYNGLRNFEFRSTPMFESTGESPGGLPGEPPAGSVPPEVAPDVAPPAPTAGIPGLISPASGSATLTDSRNNGSAGFPPSGNNGETPARRVIKGPTLAPAESSRVSPIFSITP